MKKYMPIGSSVLPISANQAYNLFRWILRTLN